MFLYTPWILSKVCLLKLLSEEIIFICFASNTELDISTQSIWLVSGFKKKFVNLFSLSQQSNPMQSIFCNIATQFAHHSFCSIVILEDTSDRFLFQICLHRGGWCYYFKNASIRYWVWVSWKVSSNKTLDWIKVNCSFKHFQYNLLNCAIACNNTLAIAKISNYIFVDVMFNVGRMQAPQIMKTVPMSHAVVVVGSGWIITQCRPNMLCWLST